MYQMISRTKNTNVRNFVIIAHIDHGKSTLADRFLELTQSVEKRKMKEQYLDQMELEREKGITIKMQPVRMLWSSALSLREPARVLNQIQNSYVLNLIDTPGHVDFSYEVSRALAAVEGAILLVDATSGIQAQTVAHLAVAVNQGLKIIPAINKIDLPQAQIEEVEEEILSLFVGLDVTFDKIYHVSAKTGEGTEELLNAVIEHIPPPTGDISKPLKALVFDSVYDEFKGVISYVRIIDGQVKTQDKIRFLMSSINADAKEVGIFSPIYRKTNFLEAGDIGYIASGVRTIVTSPIGDTITFEEENLSADKPVPGYKEPQQMVFSTVFPKEESSYDDLKDAFNKLKLNDAALYFEPEHSPILGRGLRVGFLGMLHMEIVFERLRREHGLELVVTAPSVAYKVQTKQGELNVFTPSQYPEASLIERVEEPWAHIEILVPPTYMNSVMSLLKTIRGIYKDTEYIGKDRIKINYETPLSEIITAFYDNLKNATSGFGSMAYKLLEYRTTKIEKLDILLAGEEVPSLSRLVPKEKLEKEARRLVEKIKLVIPQEQFAVAIQASVGGKIIARETKSALKKNVIAGLYGGDYTRKRKLLEKQKKGKKKLKKVGKVSVDSDTMIKLFH